MLGCRDSDPDKHILGFPRQMPLPLNRHPQESNLDFNPYDHNNSTIVFAQA